ncbi:AAA family ATPase [Streptomyces sp. NBC_01476]|uniref:AfsR/SARP family transcriptional regulator n=1 Tax=Streptomyces sp. NBC_01476 TaxID=2903881 RepID=UPI002E35C1DF|nr:BTAD domain-containing putative transcriptional regulator [Streptomyces sp. NBC_01476]
MLRIRVLGPLQADRDGAHISLGQPRQRAVLGVLLAARGNLVPAERIADSVWRGVLPDKATVSLQTYVSRLRGALEPGRAPRSPAQILVSVPPGYALRLPQEAVDAWRFEGLVARARDVAPAQARELLHEALSSWSGPAFAEHADEEWAQAEIAQLRQLRSEASEMAIAADLFTGRASAAVAAAEARAREEPLREEGWRLLILAHTATGNHAQALTALNSAEAVLREELGVRPGPSLSLVARELRAGNAAALLPREAISVSPKAGAEDTRGAEAEVVTSLPSELLTPPRRPPLFVGREPEMHALTILLERTDGVSPTTVTIHGPAGAGKTALAVHVSERLRGSFPDGVVFLDLAGTADPPLSTGAAVLALLSSMGVSDSALLREDARARIRRYHEMADSDRRLIILDNAAGEAQVRALLPYAGTTAVIVTAQRPLSGLRTSRISLGPLERSESVAMLASLVGAHESTNSRDTATVAGLCNDHPLALSIAANWLNARAGWGMANLVERLRDEDRRIGALRAGDLALGPAFSLSYRRLTPEAAAALRALGSMAAFDFGPALLAACLGIPQTEAFDLLDELMDAGWLRTSQPGRYRLYDLLRLFARQRLTAEDGADAMAGLQDRMDTWLLAQVKSAGRCFEPGNGPDPLLPPDQPAASLSNASAWLRTEAGHWLEAFRRTAAQGRFQAVIDTADSLHWFSDSWMLWGHWTEIFATAEAAAQASGDRLAEATHRNYHAWALITIEFDPARGLEEAQRALQIGRSCGSVVQQAWSHFYIAWALWRLEHFLESTESSAAAMALFREADEPNGFLSASQIYGSVILDLGRTEDARAAAEEGVRMVSGPSADPRIPENIRVFALDWYIGELARVALVEGNWEEAESHLRASLRGPTATDQPRLAALAYSRLAYVLTKLGRPDEAEAERILYRRHSEHARDDPFLEKLKAANS